MSFSTNYLFVVGSELDASRNHTGVDAGSGSPNGPGVHRNLPVVVQTPANSRESVISTSDSSFEDLIHELEMHHLNSTDYCEESPYHTADSFQEIFRSKVPWISVLNQKMTALAPSILLSAPHPSRQVMTDTQSRQQCYYGLLCLCFILDCHFGKFSWPD